MKEHEISREVIDRKCSSILKTHALGNDNTSLGRVTDIFSPSTAQYKA